MNTKSYFFQSFAIVALAFVAFIGFKQVLPNKIFSESKINSKNVLIDSLLLEAVAKDSLTENDSIDAIEDVQGKEEIVFDKIEGIEFPSETFENYKGYQYLISFYEKLYQLEKNPESRCQNCILWRFNDRWRFNCSGCKNAIIRNVLEEMELVSFLLLQNLQHHVVR